MHSLNSEKAMFKSCSCNSMKRAFLIEYLITSQIQRQHRNEFYNNFNIYRYKTLNKKRGLNILDSD